MSEFGRILAAQPARDMAERDPSFPEPAASLASLLETVEALKEAVEILLRQRGSGEAAAVRVRDIDALTLYYDRRYTRK